MGFLLPILLCRLLQHEPQPPIWAVAWAHRIGFFSIWWVFFFFLEVDQQLFSFLGEKSAVPVTVPGNIVTCHRATACSWGRQSPVSP